MTTKEKLLYIIGVLLIVFGVPFFLVGVSSGFKWTSDSKPEGMPIAEGIGLTIMMGVAPIVTGVLVCRRMKTKARSRASERTEHSIFLLAEQRGGLLTASELAMNTSLSVIEAQKILEEYTIKGITELEISDTGAHVYRFHELLSTEEKRRAEGI